MTLTIMGAGIAGCCAYRAAQDLGVPAVLTTDGNVPASAVALATLHTVGADKAADIYESWGVPVQKGAWVTGYRRNNPEPTWDKHWRAVDPHEALNLPIGQPANGRKLDCTANPSWGTISWGGTWINPDPDALIVGRQLRLHHYAPYKTLTALAWDSGARLGSSLSNDKQGAVDSAVRQMELAQDLGWVDSHDNGWMLAVNYRVRAVETVEPGRFGGFHRDGYTLAAIGAHAAVKAAIQ